VKAVALPNNVGLLLTAARPLIGRSLIGRPTFAVLLPAFVSRPVPVIVAVFVIVVGTAKAELIKPVTVIVPPCPANNVPIIQADDPVAVIVALL
jgi:hypothetical protein